MFFADVVRTIVRKFRSRARVGGQMNKLGIQAAKKQAKANPTATFLGDEVILYLEALEEAWGKLEAIREQAAYGFTGETLKNLHEGMSAQEMNSWWMRRISKLTTEEKKNY